MNNSMEMPKYQCHKEVHALKIKSIRDDDTENYYVLEFAEKGYAPQDLLDPFMDNFRGCGSNDDLGYLVVYEDGYKSWSPTKAFEDGYALVADSQQAKLKQKMEWIRNDISYKAPEQLSVELFAEYLDMINDVISK